MNKEQPAIPERSSSLINRNSQLDLREIKARKVSAMTTRSVSSSVSEFLENKINEVFLDIEYSTRFRKALIDDNESGATQHERNAEFKRAEREEREATRELVTLKRQRKLIEDDIAEAQGHDSLETAYALAMLNRDRIPRPPTKAKKNCATHTQETFRKDVGNFYEVVEYGKTKADPKILSIYCVAAHAWFDSKSVKAAHLVPKKLESAELSMLFGGEVNLSDPRNGLMLHSRIEEALDRGNIVIVPLAPMPNQLTRWKILLVDEGMGNAVAYAGPEQKRITRWKELDGRELHFLGKARPARRYLYYRYLMNYMDAKELGRTGWIERHEAHGTMWCSPGPYVDVSMLKVLAKQVSDCFLPEALYENMTFRSEEETEHSVKSEVEVSAMSLGVRIKDDRDKRGANLGEDSDGEDGGAEDYLETDDDEEVGG